MSIHFDGTLPLTQASLWCISVWLRSCLDPQNAEWRWKTDCLCIPYLVNCRAELFPIGKERLAYIFGVKISQLCVWMLLWTGDGLTDHKPLLSRRLSYITTGLCTNQEIYGHFSCLHMSTPWSSGGQSEHANADALSRLPLPTIPQPEKTPAELVLLTEDLRIPLMTLNSGQARTVPSSPVYAARLASRDKWVLTTIRNQFKKLELSSYDGYILWGSWVIVRKEGSFAGVTWRTSGHDKDEKKNVCLVNVCLVAWTWRRDWELCTPLS